ncbi:putative Peptidylprolyl isomerase [Rhodotorula taiwanensis]|uniref:Serine/threonine-protein phosphatase 2A activator n=1 Tax=Rhodotorula taiwanensis TaxID=741276 RepID=A0A2S5BFT7_9BASI|nr:putative Peptidylprolyl isomerase [Rhodotorula taiwanensis]
MTTALPTKRIVSRHHLELWLESDAHRQVQHFVDHLNSATVGVKLSDDIHVGANVQAILDVLDDVKQIYHDTPPVDNGKSRFGNPAFRTFYDKVAQRSQELHRRIPNLDERYVAELGVYFCESWGNRTRVDYGSGMELNFLCWLLCLEKLGVTDEKDRTALVIKVFWQYMQIARLLQTGYWLEPAGSHGAQGLDDYHFAVFIFGSAQLKTHKHLRPKCIHDDEILEEFSKDYMYLAYIRYINSIKTASLRWHSPMLDDISGVKTWDKVNSGMLKMYHAEVLGKLPVAQHFYFGSLLPFPVDADADSEAASAEDPDVHVDEHGHLHVRGEAQFEDCCGIKVPAIFAASQEAHQKGVAAGGGALRPLGGLAAAGGGSGAVRRIPFD